eukprot:6173152-Pleurochrysis_carterae.AAC.1
MSAKAKQSRNITPVNGAGGMDVLAAAAESSPPAPTAQSNVPSSVREAQPAACKPKTPSASHPHVEEGMPRNRCVPQLQPRSSKLAASLLVSNSGWVCCSGRGQQPALSVL